MIYRRAVLADMDRPESMLLLHRVLTIQPHGMVVDEAKVRATATHAITKGYAAVAEKDGKIVAYIGALIDEHPYYERQQMCVVAWYSDAPGAGLRLFRDMMDWRDAHPMIGTVYVFADPDERLNRVMIRYGAKIAPSYWFP